MVYLRLFAIDGKKVYLSSFSSTHVQHPSIFKYSYSVMVFFSTIVCPAYITVYEVTAFSSA